MITKDTLAQFETSAHKFLIASQQIVRVTSFERGWYSIESLDFIKLKSARETALRGLTPDEQQAVDAHYNEWRNVLGINKSEDPAPGLLQKLLNPDLEHYVKHPKVKTPCGRISMDINDEAAEILRGEDIADCYFIVAKHMAAADGGHADTIELELLEKYKHLNVGMQRMNLGNRLRKAMGTYGNINARKAKNKHETGGYTIGEAEADIRAAKVAKAAVSK